MYAHNILVAKVYFKTWTDTVNGSPPTGGGGGGGKRPAFGFWPVNRPDVHLYYRLRKKCHCSQCSARKRFSHSPRLPNKRRSFVSVPAFHVNYILMLVDTSGDAPSTLQFSDLSFDNWKGTTGGNTREDQTIFDCALLLTQGNVHSRGHRV